MKRRVAELEGALLDRAVGMASGDKYAEHPEAMVYEYSSDWHFGGPVIERERIVTIPFDRDGTVTWCAWNRASPEKWSLHDDYCSDHAQGEGPSPLTAAMRAYVASKFGDEVDLPE